MARFLFNISSNLAITLTLFSRTCQISRSFARTSSTERTGVAPWAMRRLQPIDKGEVMLPGTAISSRFWARAWAAVFRVPDCSPASTTIRISLRAEIRRFLARKLVLG